MPINYLNWLLAITIPTTSMLVAGYFTYNYFSSQARNAFVASQRLEAEETFAKQEDSLVNLGYLLKSNQDDLKVLDEKKASYEDELLGLEHEHQSKYQEQLNITANQTSLIAVKGTLTATMDKLNIEIAPQKAATAGLMKEIALKEQALQEAKVLYQEALKVKEEHDVSAPIKSKKYLEDTKNTSDQIVKLNEDIRSAKALIKTKTDSLNAKNKELALRSQRLTVKGESVEGNTNIYSQLIEVKKGIKATYEDKLNEVRSITASLVAHKEKSTNAFYEYTDASTEQTEAFVECQREASKFNLSKTTIKPFTCTNGNLAYYGFGEIQLPETLKAAHEKNSSKLDISNTKYQEYLTQLSKEKLVSESLIAASTELNELLLRDADISEQISDSTTKAQTLLQEKQDLESKQQEILAAQKILEGSLASDKEFVQRQIATLAAAEVKRDQLIQDLEKLNALTTEINQNHYINKGAFDKIQNEKTTLEDAISTNYPNLANLSEQLNKKEEELKQIEDQILANKEPLSALIDSIKSNERSIGEKKESIKVVKGSIEKLNVKIKKLTAQETLLQKELDLERSNFLS